ncbi:MAG: acyltransferase [Caulobacteraceae bacterium]|nr:acyltransferase [Caulobacteraceae bacterium]
MLDALRDLPTRLRRVAASDTYLPQIDGLRLIAIIPVLFWHGTLRGDRAIDPRHHLTALESLLSAWRLHGHAGVGIFFFLSGFIIAYPFLAGRPPKISSFYLRRLTRLEPPYFICMIVYGAILFASHHPGASKGSLLNHLLASLTYTHGLIYLDSSSIYPPAWSLEIEIQFYLLSPPDHRHLYVYSIEYKDLGRRSFDHSADRYQQHRHQLLWRTQHRSLHDPALRLHIHGRDHMLRVDDIEKLLSRRP